MRLGENVANYMVLTFAIAYATRRVGVESNVLLLALIITAAASLFTVPLIARFADSYGYYRVYVFGAAAGICLAFPFFWSLDTGNTLVIIIATLVVLTSAEITMAAVQQPIFTELFDTAFRYSGAGFAYQFTAAVGGGLTPLIAAWLVDVGGSGEWAAGYMAAVCAIALLTTIGVRHRIRATHHRGI
jgi:MHS family shikimate/dehydroshikimate transporter-like MFS transporter